MEKELISQLNKALHFMYPIILISLIGFLIELKSKFQYDKKLKFIYSNLLIISLLITFNLIMWLKRNLIQGYEFQPIWPAMILFILYYISFMLFNRKYFNNYLILIISFSLLFNFSKIFEYMFHSIQFPIQSIYTPAFIEIGHYFLILDFCIKHSSPLKEKYIKKRKNNYNKND